MGTVIWIAVVTALAAGDLNLIGNPGFETASGDRPARWDLYLMPQDGAYARLDGPGHTDAFAASIHVPLPHPKNPVNNWSQNVIGEFGGKTLALKAYVKAQDVHEAGVWVQCWRRRPLTLLDTATTERDIPVFGTVDWQLLETTVNVPVETDFLTVRCVLKGPGTVWFDDLSLTEADESATASPTATRNEDSPATGTQLPPPPVAAPVPTAVAPSSLTPVATPPPPAAAPESSLPFDLMLETNQSLVLDMDELRQSNEALLDEVMRLREEVSTLRAQLAEDHVPALPLAESNTRELRVPPIVPADEVWEAPK